MRHMYMNIRSFSLGIFAICVLSTDKIDFFSSAIYPLLFSFDISTYFMIERNSSSKKIK